MKYAVQRCCVTPAFLGQYESSTDAVLRALAVEGEDVEGFGCCGYPLKNTNHRAQVLASTRNLALAERSGLDVLTFCDCCFGSLKHAAHNLDRSPALREHISGKLAGEGLRFSGRASVKHLFQVLADDVGMDAIRTRIVRPLTGVRIAVHYGCHLLRPSNVVGFDDPRSPSIFDRLVAVTGAESVPWSRKLECCGSPMWGVDDALAAGVTGRKIASARQAGADLLCVSCPFCQLQFDRVQHRYLEADQGAGGLPVVLFTQLLGLALGLDEKVLGLGRNEMGAGGIASLPACRGGVRS